MDGLQEPASRKKSVKVVEGELHSHRWMSVSFSGLVAEPVPPHQDRFPGHEPPRRGGTPAPVPAGPALRRVPPSDIIPVNRKYPASKERAVAPQRPGPGAGPATPPEASASDPAPSPVTRSPLVPRAPHPEPASTVQQPGSAAETKGRRRSEPVAGAALAPPLRRGSGLSRPQILLCALLTLVVLGGAFYTAMRWTGRQAIIITVPEAGGSVIT